MTNLTPIQLARRYIAAMEAGDEDALPEVIHPGYRDHAGRDGGGLEGALATMRWVHRTFTNRRLTPEDLFADGDRVVARVHASMDHTGPLAGLPATGRHVETEHLHIWRIADDRLIEHWMGRDDFDLLSQLGALPGRR
jgi:predicted ester cyclase